MEPTEHIQQAINIEVEASMEERGETTQWRDTDRQSDMSLEGKGRGHKEDHHGCKMLTWLQKWPMFTGVPFPGEVSMLCSKASLRRPLRVVGPA